MPVLADPMLGARIDQHKVGAVGFSLGGYTVLELAGARTNLPAFRNFCASPAADAICRPPEMARLGDDANAPAALSAETIASIARAGASYKNPRIMAVFAIAPALGMAFDAGSFLGLDVPVALIGGTADTTVPVATNIRRIADLLPRARVTMLPGAGHYTFLNSCLPSEDERRAAISWTTQVSIVTRSTRGRSNRRWHSSLRRWPRKIEAGMRH